MKNIIIVTLAAPLIAGCDLIPRFLSPAHSPRSPQALSSDSTTPGVNTANAFAPGAGAAKSLPPAAPPEPMQLRPSDGLEVARLLERDDIAPQHGAGDDEFRREQAKGLKGDRNAAMRVAQIYEQGSNGVARDERRMVQWLKHASVLDHAGASYQLYLYYLARGLDRDAIRYERRAVRQGYTMPVRLDNRRG